ncbi:hypothetical protein H632_c361p0, partial [Helicosporidium sp. ATCC 50920]
MLLRDGEAWSTGAKNVTVITMHAMSALGAVRTLDDVQRPLGLSENQAAPCWLTDVGCPALWRRPTGGWRGAEAVMSSAALLPSSSAGEPELSVGEAPMEEASLNWNASSNEARATTLVPPPATSSHAARRAVGWVLVALTLMLAASSGIGGGGILVPLLLGLFDKDPSTAVALSNITILGGALSNLALNCGRRHPQDSARPLIDWDLSLVMEPGTVLGALVGSYLNRILPTWLTTVGLAALLTVMARKLVAKATDARRRHAREGEGDYLARLDSAGGDVWVRAPSPEYEDDETSLSTVEEGVSAQDALSLPHQNPFSASLLPDHQNSSSASLLPAAGLSAAAEIAPLLPSPFVTPALPSAASDLTFPARPSSSPQHLLTPPTSP